MNVEVARQPDENTREVWQLRFQPDTLSFHPVRFELWQETAHGEPVSIGVWKYPDFKHESTLEEPELPDWAKQDAKTYIISQIQFKT
jgi:hypothetical protein